VPLALEPNLRLARLRHGFEVNDHPYNGWLAFSAIGQHIRALIGALATGCASMPIPYFGWDGLDSPSWGGNTREHLFSIIAFGIGREPNDFKQPPGLYGKKPLLLLPGSSACECHEYYQLLLLQKRIVMLDHCLTIWIMNCLI
jgi:hypothetical protein